ncbi:hypothetical protein P4V39_10515 [Brevibacillus borstelensis]|uniref:hypothetical protein n=1 Tax=Brevibacillus TaxID=55080 RepID=UPI002E1A1F84|nr:hypothetical protein [Brevibacillus borstelensis]
MTETIGTYAGLFGGMLLGLLSLYLGNHFAKKKRALDERHHLIRTKARAASWFVTLAAIYLFFVLVLLNAVSSITFILAMLTMVHIGSWGCFVFYYQHKL